jgi:GNAT superfamily N-acetyltransferase
MNNEITISKITSGDILPNCASLLVNAYNGEPWNDKWTHVKALEKLECFYNSPKFHGWLAHMDDELVGCCVGNIEPYFTGDYFYLKEMFVPVRYQRLGIGSKLMNHISEFLSTIDIKTIILFTSKKGFPFDYWKKQKFEVMEDMQMMYFGLSE